MSLFPAYSSTSQCNDKEPENTSNGSFFPSTAIQPNIVLENPTSSIPSSSYQNYQPDILEVWTENRDKPREILLSSEDSKTDSDDSVQIIGSKTSKRKDKDTKQQKTKRKESKKKSSKKDYHRESKRKDKDKHKEKSRDKRRSLSPTSKPTQPDNSYLAYLPRRANFIEDIPNLRSEDAYRIDRRPDADNRAFNSMYDKFVPKYSFRELINTTRQARNFNDQPLKKKKKIKRYYKLNKKRHLNCQFSYLVRPSEEYNGEEYLPIPTDWNQLPGESSKDSLSFQSFQTEPQTASSASTTNQRFHELTTVFNRLVTDQPNQTQLWIDFIRFQDLLLAGSSLKFASEKKLSIAERALESNRRSVPLHLVKLKLLSAYYPELVAKVSDVDAEWKRVCFLFPTVSELWFDYSRFTFRCASVLAFKATSRTRKVMTTAFKNLSGKVLEGDFVSHQVDASKLEKRLVDLAAMVSKFLRSIDQSEKATAIWQALVEFNLYTPEDLKIEGSTLEDWFVLFEQFWDSSLSRVGEFSPITWSQFRALTVSGDVSALQAPKNPQNAQLFDQDKLIDETESQVLEQLLQNANDEDSKKDQKSQIWLHYERLRQSLYWLPASAGAPTGLSMEDIEDLERVVLSDEDVKPWLFRLRLCESKWYLVKGFLEYLGVPLVTFSLDSAGSTSRFEVEATTEHEESDVLFQSTTSNSKLFECSLSFTRGQRFESPSEVIVMQKFGLQSLLNPRIGDYGLVLRVQDDLSKVDTTVTALKDAVVCNFLVKVVEYSKRWPNNWRKDLILVWIRYKLARYQAGLEKAKSMRKFIKDFLREEAFRNCLDIWFAYCAFEYAESREAGRKFFVSTVQLMLSSKSSDDQIPTDLLQFTLGFVRLELDLDQVMNHFLYHTVSTVEKCQVCRRKSTKTDDGSELKSKLIALRFLVSVINGDATGLTDLTKTTGPTEIVRAIRKLKDDQDKVQFFHAKVMLIYLSKGITETIDILSHQCHFSPNSSTRSHQLLQVQLLLHSYSFGMSMPSQPSVTRSLISTATLVIKSALKVTPSDPLFLSLLISLEIQFNHLWFRLRRDLGGSPTAQFESYLVKQYLEDGFEPCNRSEGSQESNWDRFMATLHGELLILDRYTQSKDLELAGFDINSGVINRIRHLFERALHYRVAANEDSTTVNSDGTFATPNLDDDWLYGKSLADCPTIWRLFLRFELKISQNSSSQHSGAAKAIIYRGLQHCPNAKSLYLDAINFFPELYQEMVDIMTDKQLRVRTTVEEIDMFVEAQMKE